MELLFQLDPLKLGYQDFLSLSVVFPPVMLADPSMWPHRIRTAQFWKTVHMGQGVNASPKLLRCTTCKNIQGCLGVWTHSFFIKPGKMTVKIGVKQYQSKPVENFFSECMCAHVHMRPRLPVWCTSRSDVIIPQPHSIVLRGMEWRVIFHSCR